ncbi:MULTISPECIES: GNAT family N-acetyltransferase [Virgibacillus]|uniref:N-acetyltransferase domain-containing protein n=2 Tax=Virgibacillus TaxID=84406 RepID=A0ABQ2DWS5_9BACI|nr:MULTISPECIES: GNAT family N-acetyltransferase [Virgibacillus]EQB35276.1 hypothetical protein M948_19445 [Virgibacillus sp. CM-4]MYL42694.1 GNAT family N-acetyltransferase [Virgibacillus massiliensis]GGJ76093.1 hypothetical protein GCM10007111_42070 [Virgibacillus kapii]CDQ40581.1 putative acetyltransferase involved in intracellular survival [Virgibacillus massiliensis]
MKVRLAEVEDIKQLIKMRWDFTVEYDKSKGDSSFRAFEMECHSFLEKALINNDQWFIWIAEVNEEIVSHIYIELIDKVPRPGRITYPFAYMTNVYTIPKYRNKGIGSKLLQVVNKWSKKNNFEFIMVWPSEDSNHFYQKNGYTPCSEQMEFFPR